MKIFDKEKAVALRQKNKKARLAIAVSFAAAALAGILSVCMADTWGRGLCQTLASVTTALFGCFCLVWVQGIRHRDRLIALCEKQPGPLCTGLVRSIQSHTTTLEGLSFYGMDVELDGKTRTYFLHCRAADGICAGQTLRFTAGGYILLTAEVVE